MAPPTGPHPMYAMSSDVAFLQGELVAQILLTEIAYLREMEAPFWHISRELHLICAWMIRSESYSMWATQFLTPLNWWKVYTIATFGLLVQVKLEKGKRGTWCPWRNCKLQLLNKFWPIWKEIQCNMGTMVSRSTTLLEAQLAAQHMFSCFIWLKIWECVL